MVKRLILFTMAVAMCAAAIRGEARYIFLFIGDGMGMGHVMTTMNYLRTQKEGNDSLLMTTFPNIGIVTTYSASSPVTDSAAAGTAIACGKKTTNRTIGLTPDGEPLESLASVLHKNGYGVGLVTTVAPDDATPAAFYAHVADRYMFDDIANDAIASGYEFIGGANLRGDKSLYKKFADNGISVARGMEGFKKVNTRRTLVLNTDTALTNDLGYLLDGNTGALDLPQMTQMCLSHLMRHTPDKFFIMSEGGSIDHAAHANDGASVIKEMESFNKAISLAYDFYLQHPDETIILITADHDTGGMATVNNGASLAATELRKISKDRFNDWLKGCTKRGEVPSWAEMSKTLTEKFGFGGELKISEEEMASLKSDYEKFLKGTDTNSHASTYASYSDFVDNLYRLADEKATIRWITNEHTANPVGIFAIGNGTEELSKMIDNTQIHDFILKSSI